MFYMTLSPEVAEALILLAKRKNSKHTTWGIWRSFSDGFLCYICECPVKHTTSSASSFQTVREIVYEHALDHLKQHGLLAII